MLLKDFIEVLSKNSAVTLYIDEYEEQSDLEYDFTNISKIPTYLLSHNIIVVEHTNYVKDINPITQESEYIQGFWIQLQRLYNNQIYNYLDKNKSRL